MNATRISVLALALLAAGVAAFLVRGLVIEGNQQSASGPVEPAIKMVGVLVAANDLTPGYNLRGNDTRWQQWPETAVTSVHITQTAAPDARSDFSGSIVRRNFVAGEPIVASALVRAGDAGLMAALILPGMRAMAISVSDENSAGGFILPGDRVDVVVTREMGRDRSNRSYVSETVLYNIRVLAIDQTFSEEVSGGSLVGDTITVELTPRQAETLALAQAIGDVSLALRSFADVGLQDETADGFAPNILSSGGNEQTSQVRVLRNGMETSVRVQGGM